MNVTYKQREILLDSLKVFPYIIRGRLSRKPESRRKLKAIWEDISNKLNSSGEGPMKTVQEWMKCCADWKMYVRKKETNHRRGLQATDGEPTKLVHFSNLEEQLLEILNSESAEMDNIPDGGLLKRLLNCSQHPNSTSSTRLKPDTKQESSTDTDTDVDDSDPPPKKCLKKKIKVNHSNVTSENIQKPIDMINPSIDDNQIFGNYVASELGQLINPNNKRRLKHLINQAIMQISDEDAQEREAYNISIL